MTERDFEIMLYGITANVIEKIAELNNWTEDVAMERFAQSKVYSYLEREKTKVWHYSPLMLAQLFNEERAGKFSLPEV
ncbi:MAG: hypothetical protein IJX10_06965 [Phascolarctobacterium sp.]|nr:hypothetical protein [Phascolarctobacterium sp.]